MNINIINKNFDSVEDAMSKSGLYASLCYSSSPFSELKDKGDKSHIAKFCLKSGHHSIFDHLIVTLSLENIPKILVMLLNNIGSYNTSERSGRYTEFKDNKMYNKWKDIFKKIIENNEDVRIKVREDEKLVNKLSLENARYFLPIELETNLIYSISIRQLSYLCFILSENDYTDFYEPLQKAASEFVLKIKELGLYDFGILFKDGQDVLMKNKLSFNNKMGTNQRLSRAYELSYKCSFACVGQLQRHRTSSIYFGELVDEYYIPDIIKHTEYEEEYLNDIKNLEYIPLARMINISETGNEDGFKLKSLERLCSRAQLEISKLVKLQMEHIMKDESFYDNENDTALTRCKNFKCNEPCCYGIHGLDRKI